jgi:hypothetical protein
MNATQPQDLGSLELEAQVYAELEAAEAFIPTVRPSAGMLNALRAACAADLFRSSTDASKLMAEFGL